MSLLVPDWTYNYSDFWNTIRRRNLWLIKIRYFAAIGLLSFLFLGKFLFQLNFTNVQITSISAIAFSIFLYNVFFQVIRKYILCDPVKFNCMHLSLLQMLADLVSLMLLIYYTGLIESPLYVFFIFHMVIGSMILPGVIIYSICAVVVFVYSLLIHFQRIDIIPTHSIKGLLVNPVNYTLSYDIIFVLVFGMLMFLTVIIANRMARNLLKREEQLRFALEQLNNAEITKQKYIMGVVHEIKSPIAAIKSLVEVILKKYLGPINGSVEEKLMRINLRVDEGLELINNVLRISRLKLLEQTFFEYFDLKETFRETIKQKNDLISSKLLDVKIVENFQNGMNYYGDKALISLVFSNLISNSIKYTDNGGTIWIEFDKDQSYYIIKIIDDGIGIPEKDLKKVFEQFYRGSNLKDYKSEGSGLGLSLVKEIISYHNGEIEVESPSKLSSDNRPGVCFIVKLPATLGDNMLTEKVSLIRGKI